MSVEKSNLPEVEWSHVININDIGDKPLVLTIEPDDAASARLVRRFGLLALDECLYTGTEMGVYVSFNGGQSWSSLQLNLPIVPITDLIQRHGDLIVATQGRSFWVLDDIGLIRQYAGANDGKADLYLKCLKHSS